MYIPPSDATQEKIKKGEDQAIDIGILETILVKDSAKDIWNSMKKKYQWMRKQCSEGVQTSWHEGGGNNG